MYIISKTPNPNGSYPAIQTWDSNKIPEGYVELPKKFYDVFYMSGKLFTGFLKIEFNKDGTEIINATWDDEKYNAYVSSLPSPISTAKKRKCEELSEACGKAINDGGDVNFEDGTILHYAYNIEEQNNISEMILGIFAGITNFPYHASNEDCRLYTAKEIVTIYTVLSNLKISQITYQNQLKSYVNTLETVREIESVYYGQALTGVYLERYNNLMAEATVQMGKVISQLNGIRI